MKRLLIALLLCLPVFGSSIISFSDREDGGTAISGSTSASGFDPCCGTSRTYTVRTDGPERAGYLAVSYGAQTAFGSAGFSIGSFQCSTSNSYSDGFDCNADSRALLIPFGLGTSFDVSISSSAYPVFFGTYATGWFDAELFESADDGRSDPLAGDPVAILQGFGASRSSQRVFINPGVSDVTGAPEPGTMSLGFGILGLSWIVRRMRRG